MTTTKRQHASRKAAGPADKPVDPRDTVIQALQADVGPLAITITGNLVTRRVQVIDNAESEAHLSILLEWLDSARDYLNGKLLKAAEARGRATAGQGSAPADSPKGP